MEGDRNHRQDRCSMGDGADTPLTTNAYHVVCRDSFFISQMATGMHERSDFYLDPSSRVAPQEFYLSQQWGRFFVFITVPKKICDVLKRELLTGFS